MGRRRSQGSSAVEGGLSLTFAPVCALRMTAKIKQLWKTRVGGPPIVLAKRSGGRHHPEKCTINVKKVSAGGSVYSLTGSRLHKSGTCGPNMVTSTQNLSAGGSMYSLTGSRLHRSGTCGPNVVTSTQNLSAGGSMYSLTGSRPTGFRKNRDQF